MYHEDLDNFTNKISNFLPPCVKYAQFFIDSDTDSVNITYIYILYRKRK